MKKRFSFKCWNCDKTYTLFKEITKEQTIIVACPYCNLEAAVDLNPFRKKIKAVLRGTKENEQDMGDELSFPNVIPTQRKIE